MTTSVRRLPPWVRRVPVFVGVGVAWTALYLGLYGLLRLVVEPQLANLVSLVVTTLGATDGHRRLTFKVHDDSVGAEAGQQVVGLVLLGVGLALTSGSLWLLDVVDPGASTLAELVVLLAANGLAGVVRFGVLAVLMRSGDALHPAS